MILVKQNGKVKRDNMVDESLRVNLRNETLKWLKRAEEKLQTLSGDKNVLRNIRAYLDDSKWFLEKGDFIRAFECVIWAWAWMEIAEEVGLLKN